MTVRIWSLRSNPFFIFYMERKEFMNLISTGLAGMATLGNLSAFSEKLPQQNKKMPVLFVGHGSPMNGIEENEFSGKWSKIGREIPTPQAVLCISAHWLTKVTLITAMENSRTIYDFAGFPKELYNVKYPAPGSPLLANEIKSDVKLIKVGIDHEWGLDHGCWTVVRHMFPDAKIPVLQLSIDYGKPTGFHYSLAQELNGLRKKGVLIIGSGNMVHNLGMIAWNKLNEPDFGFDWAREINYTFKKLIKSGDHKSLIEYESLGLAAKKAIPTSDHYLPLIYSLGLQDNKDSIEFFNDKCVGGSLTMTSVIFSQE